MRDKAIFIIVFMYVASFSFLGVQFSFFDILDIELQNADGELLKPAILSDDILAQDTLNSATSDVINQNQTTIEQTPSIGAAQAAWDVIQLITGTYIFNILGLIGLPQIWINGMVVTYAIFLGMTLIMIVRGI